MKKKQKKRITVPIDCTIFTHLHEDHPICVLLEIIS